MWLTSTTVFQSQVPTRNVERDTRQLPDGGQQAWAGLRLGIVLLSLLLSMLGFQRAHGQATIVVAKKAQSEINPGVNFGFTSTIPGGSTFTLNDGSTYVSMQDVGMGNNNTVWAIGSPATFPGDGAIYYRAAGATSWTRPAGFGTRIDVDLNGKAYLCNSSGTLYQWGGTAFVQILGASGVVDVGVSAGTARPLYLLTGSGPCYTLYRWNGANNSFTAFPGTCGTRLDVAPDGSVWILNSNNQTVYRVTIAGTVATVAGSYPAPSGSRDITVAADGTVWIAGGLQSYRLSGTTWVLDANSGGTLYSYGGISAGSDGDVPIVTYNTATGWGGRLVQRQESGVWLDDHAIGTSGAGNTVIYNVAPGTYTITENAPASPWELTGINTAGGTTTTNLGTRTATVTVTAGQTAHVEFVNNFIQNSVISNSCGTPYVETFGASGSTTVSLGPALPNGYTPYHYNGQYPTNVTSSAGMYTLTNNMSNMWGGLNAPDHTGGDTGGYMLMVNGGFPKDEVFRRRFSGLLPGALYSLSLWASNMTNGTNYVRPNLMLEARQTNGTLIASQSTGNISYTFVNDWRQYGLTFTADASGTVDFIIRNNQQTPGIYGNDFVIDDITVGVACDYGDAPASYGTTLNANGASHKGTANLLIGTLIDTESDGIAGTGTGDDLTNLDDEDGVNFPPLCTGNTSYTASVVNVINTVAPSARLIAWIDFNRNGTFEASEGTTLPAGSSGAYTLSWAGLSGLSAGVTYARVRLTSDPAITVNTPTGPANDGEVEDYQIVINNGGGTVTASATSLTTCSGDPVSITYTTGPTTGQTVRWTRMPGNVTALGAVSEILSNTTTAPLSYTYTAIIADIYGCPSTAATTVVTVNPRPIITPSVCSQTICSGQTGVITFDVTIPGSTIRWERTPTTPAPASGTGNISQQLFNTGPTSVTYTYKVWADSPAPASCPSSTTITCEIVVTPGLDVTALVAGGSGCVGSPLSLSASVTQAGSYTYTWAGPNGYVGTGANPEVSASAALTDNGSYTVTVTDVSGCSGTTVVDVVVQDCCFDLAATSNSPVCATNTLIFNAFTQGGSGNFTYLWTGPNSFSSTLPNPTIPDATTAASGLYTLVVTDVTSACSQTATTAVTIATQPVLAVTGSPSLTICSGQSTTLSVGGSNGATVTWTSSIGQNGTGTSINTDILTNNGTAPMIVAYYLLANAGDGECTDQDTVLVTVNPAPHLQVIPTSSVVCDLEQVTVRAIASASTTIINWTRTPNTPGTATGTGTSSVLIQEVLPPANYTYEFTATGANGCTSQPMSVPVTVQQ